MKKSNLEKILNLIRESMMTTNSTAGKPGFSSKANADGPTAGYDKPLKKRYIWTRGIRKNWKKKDETK